MPNEESTHQFKQEGKGEDMAKAKAKSNSAKAATKSEIVGTLADKSGLTKRQVASIFDDLSVLVKKDLGKRGPGVLVSSDARRATDDRRHGSRARTDPWR